MPENQPVEQSPLWGFRALRRDMANHPQHHSRKSVVEVHDLDLDWIDYKIETFSTPDAEDRTVFMCFIEYIDRQGEAHQIALPSEVVGKMSDHINALMKGAKSRRAKRAAATRKTRANARKTSTN